MSLVTILCENNDNVYCMYFRYCFVVSFVGHFFPPSKSSPIYGGVRLIVSGETGCNIVINFGGSFLGLTDF